MTDGDILPAFIAPCYRGIQFINRVASVAKNNSGPINNTWSSKMTNNGDKSTPPINGTSFCTGFNIGRVMAPKKGCSG